MKNTLIQSTYKRTKRANKLVTDPQQPNNIIEKHTKTEIIEL